MSELNRDARAFLAAAEGAPDARPGARDRVREGLAAALSASVGALAPPPPAAVRWLPALKMTTLLAVVGVGAAALLAHGRAGTIPTRPAREAPVVHAVASPAPIPSTTIDALPVVAAAPASPSVPTTTIDALPLAASATSASASARVSALARKHEVTAPKLADVSVAAEVALLERASGALRAGDPKRALAAVSEHARRFPNGALAEERDTERIVALCALGRRDEAATATQRFDRAYPSSSHAARIRAACASPSAPGGTP